MGLPITRAARRIAGALYERAASTRVSSSSSSTQIAVDREDPGHECQLMDPTDASPLHALPSFRFLRPKLAYSHGMATVATRLSATHRRTGWEDASYLNE